MFTARPVYNVFVVDRFEVIAANAIDEESREKAAPEFRSLPLTGPKVGGAREPDDPKRMSDIVIVGGGRRRRSRESSRSVRAVRAGPAGRRHAPRNRWPSSRSASRRAPPTIRAFVAASGRAEDAVGFLPMKARNQDMAVVVDKKSGEIVGIVPVNPW